jgi:tetratricopeptide (TPR) repeat protein
MKKIILTTICWALLTAAFGQTAIAFYEKGVEKASEGKLEEAINLFSKSIDLNPEDYYSWYNRGIAKTMLKNYEDALLDFAQTIKLAPHYKKGWLNRGTLKKRLTDYEGALSDYSNAIKLDSNYADGYYNRGLIYELLNKKDSACMDFHKAKNIGLKDAIKKVDKCNDKTTKHIETHSIVKLTKTANNDKYGFTSEKPIMVGFGLDGGPANQKAYMNLLRDQQGKAIKYERLNSCCGYKSNNSFLGLAMLDRYEITYFDEKGIVKKAIIYISFYDYEEPQILFGFKTIGQK